MMKAPALLVFAQAILFTLCLHAAAASAFQPSSSQQARSFTKPFLSDPSESETPHQIMNEDLNIAVLGGGNVGTILAQMLKESNKFASVTIAARNLEKTCIEVKAKGLDLDVGHMSEVLPKSQVIILATKGLYEDDEMKRFCHSLGDMSGVIIIDATNPLTEYSDGLQVRTWEEGISSGEKLQQYLPTAKVYKSFNTVGLEHMKEALGKDMLICGDPDISYRLIAEEVVKAVGFKPFYVGPIRYARNLEAMAELWIHMAIPGLGGRDASRNFWFSISGDP